jgi:hypothetical protein
MKTSVSKSSGKVARLGTILHSFGRSMSDACLRNHARAKSDTPLSAACTSIEQRLHYADAMNFLKEIFFLKVRCISFKFVFLQFKINLN